jgi:integrase
MAAFKSHGRGSYVLKGTFAGVRIERASGTGDGTTLRRLREMCRTLADAGRLDVLEAIRDGQVQPLEVWRHYRAGDWSHLPTAAHVQPLAASWKAWLPTVPGSRHRRDLDVAGRQLLALGPSNATLADVPALVEAFRRRCESHGYSRQFNKVRDAASAFLRRVLTRQHALYQAVRAIEPLPVTPRYAKRPQGPAAARTIADVLSGEPGRIWWALCCTGMGPDEYFGGKWAIEDDVLHVRGTKRRGRDRLVPLLVDLEPPVLTVWGFRSALKRSGLGVHPYDARRSFANWMEQAGIWETHQQAYMGHGPRTITDLYRRHEVVHEHLERDGDTLYEFILRSIAGGISGGTVEAGEAVSAMTGAGLEPATCGLKVRCSTN